MTEASTVAAFDELGHTPGRHSRSFVDCNKTVYSARTKKGLHAGTSENNWRACTRRQSAGGVTPTNEKTRGETRVSDGKV